MFRDKKILVTGGSGMVGMALKKILPDAIYISSKEADLREDTSASCVINFHQPDIVIHLAAKVGGVLGNKEKIADFFEENMQINLNVLKYSKECRVKKVISLLSTCIYPDDVKYPLTEDQIHNGFPHSSNYGYAFAKRSLDIQSRVYREQYGCNFITAVPNNVFGPFDNFHLENSHVIPAMIRKIYEAKLKNKDVILWGDGSPLREFTYSEDIAHTILFLLDNYDGATPINIGNNSEISIKTLAETIASVLQYSGKIIWDTSKPSGQQKKPSLTKKLMDLGYKHKHIVFEDGIERTCEWFVKNYPNVRGINE